MCFMQEIMYYLLFYSCKNHFLVQIYVDLLIPKRKSGQFLHACILEMLIRLILPEIVEMSFISETIRDRAILGKILAPLAIKNH